MTKIQDDLDAAVQAIADENTVVDSAIALLDQLFALVQANINNPAALEAAIAAAQAKKQDLANAVVRNTPAA